MKTNSTDRAPGSLMDQKSEEWLVGFRIGQIFAEEMTEVMRQGGRIDVLDASGKLIFSSRIRDLLTAEKQQEAEERCRP